MKHPTDALGDVELSVVVACVDARNTIRPCLAALEVACRGCRAEIILADGSIDETTSIVRSLYPSLRIVQHPPGTLVPYLWAAGLEIARGGAVAFTLGNMMVGRRWAQAMLAGLEQAAGVGGPLLPADGGGIVDWAVFYLRYSAFLPIAMPDGPVRGEIAGDNAAYKHSVLERHRPTVEQGFWEVDFHRQLRADGETLAAAADAAAAFAFRGALATIARHRYAHGREFGSARVARGESRARLVCAAPLVPLLLAGRAASRVIRQPGSTGKFLASLPVFLALAACWAVGEASGALRQKSPGV